RRHNKKLYQNFTNLSIVNNSNSKARAILLLWRARVGIRTPPLRFYLALPSYPGLFYNPGFPVRDLRFSRIRAHPSMNGTRVKLSVMMFLEFFIWGAWLPLFFAYLPERGFSSSEQSWILNTFAIASFVGMFFINQFADRNFYVERILEFCHLITRLAYIVLYHTNIF